jgi:hypothetical protein
MEDFMIELELTIDEWVGTNMRAYPTLFYTRMKTLFGMFVTIGAGYYWKNGMIGNYLVTQRSIDALEQYRSEGFHIPDGCDPYGTCDDVPPYASGSHGLLTSIPDDVQPDALAAAWEVLEALDQDPGDEPVELPPKPLSEDAIACNKIAHECLVEILSEDWGLSIEDTEARMEENRLRNEESDRDTPSPKMRDWIIRKSNQAIAKQVKGELIERGLVV